IESRELNHFTPADEQLLQTLADQAAVALENARLYRASQEQIARLAALNAISAVVVSSLEPDTVLCQALESVCQVLDAVEGSILLRDPDTGELVFKHVLGDNEVFLRGQHLAPGQGVAGWVAQHSQAVCVNDVRHDARFYAGTDTASGFETRSLLCAPLLYRGEIVGVTEIVNKRQGRFTSEDLNLLEAASFIVTQSLENARLYQDLLIQMQAREKAQAQLVHSEKMGALGRLTASLAHEINNPLQAMQSCLTLATERLEYIPHGEKLDRYLSIIGDETERVSNIVRRVSGFYRPAREELRLTDLHTVLESTLQLVGKQLQHADITVEREWTEELPLIPANPDQLKQVCLNLVLNALDAMPEGGTLRVRTALEAPDFLRIEFSDTGVGMSPETQSRLFEPFFTTKEQGSGLGLSISYGIIKAHNGEITVTSEEGRGTTFTILLPVEGRVKRET
ncbi:MAG: GAF domain-containing protein, partial [Anaerolineae bacterium]|nr:GAF domain-containing protein [Anaerolineae bacterium]